jgi:hypothetical protein
VALSRYVITAPVIVPAGTPAPLRLASPAREALRASATWGISAGYAAFSQSFQPGMPIVFESASSLYAALNGRARCGRMCRAPTT